LIDSSSLLRISKKEFTTINFNLSNNGFVYLFQVCLEVELNIGGKREATLGSPFYINSPEDLRK
jgi:hypothetical protein